MGAVKVACVLAGGLMLSGCLHDREINDLKAKQAETEKQMQTLTAELESFKASYKPAEVSEAITELQDTIRWDKLLRTMDKTALLTPGEQGYSTVKYELGVITIGIADIKPFANGSKVKLKFGNTIASTVNGLSAKIDWGKLDSEGRINSEGKLSKDIKIIESLRPGTWTHSSVVLEKIPPSDLGYIRISNLSHQGLEMAVK